MGKAARFARIALFATLALAVAAAPAEAAFPGANGRLVWATPLSYPAGLETADERGLLYRRLVTGSARNPAWSPDGTRIVFVSTDDTIELMDVAGNRTEVLRWPRGVGRIDWSPAGNKLAANLVTCDDEGYDCRMDIYTMALDGTDLTNVTPEPLSDNEPSWSPDGTRIAFWSMRDGATDIYTIAPDGSRLANLTGDRPETFFSPDWSPDGRQLAVFMENPTRQLAIMDPTTAETTPVVSEVGLTPAWSPDGTRIAFDNWFGGVSVVNSDGSDQRYVGYGREPDWQPVHIARRASGYPRPKRASPIRVSLVQAFPRCGSQHGPHYQHGPPLAYPSCSIYLDSYLPRIGHNKMTGRVRLDAVRGSPRNSVDDADVEISIEITDVSCTWTDCGPDDGTYPHDYARDLLAAFPLQITDRLNGAPPEDASATTVTGPLAFLIPCAPNSDTTIGATCSVTTTADSVLPGSVPEGRRSIWQLGQITIYRDTYLPTLGEEDAVFRQGVYVR